MLGLGLAYLDALSLSGLFPVPGQGVAIWKIFAIGSQQGGGGFESLVQINAGRH